MYLTCTEDRRPLGRGVSLSSCLLLSAGHQPLLLLLLCLWPVLVGQLEQLCGWREHKYKLVTQQFTRLCATWINTFLRGISDLGGCQHSCSVSKYSFTSFATLLSTQQPTTPSLSSLTGLAVQSLGELVDRRGDLQTLVEDGALPLQADVTRPFHKACQITLWLDILACRGGGEV